MGLLNLMVFQAHHLGDIQLGFADFQVIFPDFSQHQLRRRFDFKDGQPVINLGDVQILHMPDKKPLVNNPDCYSLPMTYFRLKFLEDTEGLTGDAAMARLLQEDTQFYNLRRQSLRNHRLRLAKKLLTGHPGEWRRLAARLTPRKILGQ